MKRLQYLTLSLVIVFLSSCSNIVYHHPIPKDQISLAEFPSELQGYYVDSDGDTLCIASNKYSYGEMNNQSFLQGELGADLVLKKLDSYYFMNFKNEDGYWEMIAAQLSSEQLSLFCIDIENKEQIKLVNQHIEKGKVRSTKKDGKYIINPSDQEILNLLNDSRICQKELLNKLK
ncbi:MULTISPECIES: hypothetical protein [unclassified Lentimicrobium]|uniref:hypothetical protein n=1 Tax=unclassified Lentimicrobium TaxID=2677434 RepID=UPI0015551C2A|nr:MULTISPECIES: hypothetical protein [unclassified Lentimicrobium]NPD45329.1 hypothetical protein [Lentimicrobium sp. S6]NPD84372.1 hypothetical protein [Lentimicrobium sp. L6]